ncbi:MAG TPA: beta-N-acetylhexosaminidase [Myxococcota bacterium]|nr:beta-N-acetylhexosaminidase [Myxococcota bacterium]
MSKLEANELFIFGFNGTSLSLELKKFLAQKNNGGIILFRRNIESIEQVIALNTEIIESNAAYPPIISVDQEGGRVARLRGITCDIPPMGALRSIFLREPQLCYRLGAMIARELVALGFNLDFAPICDIAINQKHDDIVGDRAFSDNAEEVAQLGALFIKGMQGAGLAACAKHFPGHGSTSVDSHFDLPKVATKQELMRARELVPFRSAIDANVATIMTAHIVATDFDTLPATLSPMVIAQLLRHELGFKEVVISDDLDMQSIANHYELRDIIEQAMMASIDMFIIGNNFEKTHEAIAIAQELIDSNEHIKNMAQKAIVRIRHLRSRFLGAPAIPNASYAKSVVKSLPHLELLEACR